MDNKEKEEFNKMFKKPMPQTIKNFIEKEIEARDKNYKDGDDFIIENVAPESLKESIKPANNLFSIDPDEVKAVFGKDFGDMRKAQELKVPQMLRDAAKIYEDRNKIYGDNYKHFGFVFKELFPEGLELKTPKDFNRLGILVQMVAKMTRYVANFNKGGHADSLDDLAVYTMMLRELDIDD